MAWCLLFTRETLVRAETRHEGVAAPSFVLSNPYCYRDYTVNEESQHTTHTETGRQKKIKN